MFIPLCLHLCISLRAATVDTAYGGRGEACNHGGWIPKTFKVFLIGFTTQKLYVLVEVSRKHETNNVSNKRN